MKSRVILSLMDHHEICISEIGQMDKGSSGDLGRGKVCSLVFSLVSEWMRSSDGNHEKDLILNWNDSTIGGVWNDCLRVARRGEEERNYSVQRERRIEIIEQVYWLVGKRRRNWGCCSVCHSFDKDLEWHPGWWCKSTRERLTGIRGGLNWSWC